MSLDDEIVMTPLQVETGTTVKIERVQKEDFDASSVQLFAGGPYKGIIIRKQVHEYPDAGLPDESREFVCYVNNPKLEEDDPDAVIKEKRTLRFWFSKGTPETAKKADHFLEQILQPHRFPKSSIFYVKKLITQMRTKLEISKMESEMRELEPGEEEWMRSTRKQITRVSITAVLTRYPKKSADDQMNDLNEEDAFHIHGELMENGYQGDSIERPDDGKPRDRRTWPHHDDYNYEHQGGVVIEILDQEGTVVKTVEEGDVYVQPPKSPVKRKHSLESDDEDDGHKRISFFAKLRDSMRDNKSKSKSPTPDEKDRDKKEKDEKRKSKIDEKERKEKEKNEKAAILRKKKEDDKARKAQEKKEKDEKRKSKKDDDDVEEKMEIDPAVGVVLAAERPRTSESEGDKPKESESDSSKPLLASGSDDHDPKHIRTDVVLTAHVRSTSVSSDEDSPDKQKTKRKHPDDKHHDSEPEGHKDVESGNEEHKGKPTKSKKRKKGRLYLLGRKSTGSSDSEDEEGSKKGEDEDDKHDKDASPDDGKDEEKITSTTVTLAASAPTSPGDDDTNESDKKKPKDKSILREKKPKDKKDKANKRSGLFSFGRKSGIESDSENEEVAKRYEPDDEKKDDGDDIDTAGDDGREVSRTTVTLEAKGPRSPSELNESHESDGEKKTWSLKRDKKPKDKEKDKNKKRSGFFTFGRKPSDDSDEDDKRKSSEHDDDKNRKDETGVVAVGDNDDEVTRTTVTLEAHVPGTPHDHDDGQDSDTDKKKTKQDKKPKDKVKDKSKKKGGFFSFGRKHSTDSEDEDPKKKPETPEGEGKEDKDVPGVVVSTDDDGKEVTRTMVTLEAKVPKSPSAHDDSFDGDEKKTWSLKRDKPPKDKTKESDKAKKKGVFLSFGRKSGAASDSEDDTKDKKDDSDHEGAAMDDEGHDKEVTTTAVTLEAKAPKSPSHHDDEGHDSDAEKKTWSLKRDKKPKDKSKDTEHKHKGISLSFGRKPRTKSETDDDDKHKEKPKDDHEPDDSTVVLGEDNDKEMVTTSVTLEARAPKSASHIDDENHDSDAEKKTWSLKRDKKPKDKNKDTERKKKGISLTFGRKPHDSEDEEEGKKKDDKDSTEHGDDDDGKEVTTTAVTLEAHAPRTPTGHDDDSDTEKKTWSLKRDKKPKEKDTDSDRKKKGISLTLFGKKPHDHSHDDDEGKKTDDEAAVIPTDDDEKEVTKTSVTLEAHAPTTPTGHDKDSETGKKTWSFKRNKEPKDKSRDSDRKKKGISLTLFGKKPHDDSRNDDEGGKKDDEVAAIPADDDNEKEVTRTTVTLEAHAPSTPTGHDDDSDTEKKTWSLKRDKKPKDKNKDTEHKKKGISLIFGRKPHDSEAEDEGKKKDDKDSSVHGDDDDGKEVTTTAVTLEAHAPRTPTGHDDSDTEKKTWSLKRDKKPKEKDTDSDRKKKGISLTLFGKKPHDHAHDDDEGKKTDDEVAAIPTDGDEKEVTKTSVTLEAHVPSTPTGHDDDIDTEKKTWSLKRDKKPKEKDTDSDRKKKGISLTLFGKKPHDDSRNEDEGGKKDDEVAAAPAGDDNEKEVTKTTVTLEAHTPSTPTGHDNDGDTEKKTWSLKRDKKPKEKDTDSDRKKKGISLTLFGKKPHDHSHDDDDEGKKTDDEAAVIPTDDDNEKEVTTTSVTLEAHAPTTPTGHDKDSETEKKTWSLKRDKEPKDKSRDSDRKKKGIFLSFGRKPRTKSEEDKEEEKHKDDHEHEVVADDGKEVVVTTVTLEAKAPKSPSHLDESDVEKKTWSLKRDKKPKDKDKDTEPQKKGISLMFGRKPRTESEADEEQVHEEKHKDDHGPDDSMVLTGEDNDKEVVTTSVTLEAKAPKSPSEHEEGDHDSDAEKKTWSLKRDKRPKDKDTDRKKKGISLTFGRKSHEDSEDQNKDAKRDDKDVAAPGHDDKGKEVTRTTVTLEAHSPRTPTGDGNESDTEKKTWSLKRDKKPKDKNAEPHKKKGGIFTFKRRSQAESDDEDRKDKGDDSVVVAEDHKDQELLRTTVTLEAKGPHLAGTHSDSEDVEDDRKHEQDEPEVKTTDEDGDKEVLSTAVTLEAKAPIEVKEEDKKTWSLKRDKKPKDKKDDDEKPKKKGLSLTFGRKPDAESKDKKDKEHEPEVAAAGDDHKVIRTEVTLAIEVPASPSVDNDGDVDKKTWSLKREKKPKDTPKDKDDKHKKKGVFVSLGKKHEDEDTEKKHIEDDEKKEGDTAGMSPENENDEGITRTTVTLEASAPKSPSSHDESRDSDSEKKTWSLKRDKKPKDKIKKKGGLFTFGRKSDAESDKEEPDDDKKKSEKRDSEVDIAEDGDKEETKTTVTLEAKGPSGEVEPEKKTWSLKREKKPKDKKKDKGKKRGLLFATKRKSSSSSSSSSSSESDKEDKKKDKTEGKLDDAAVDDGDDTTKTTVTLEARVSKSDDEEDKHKEPKVELTREDSTRESKREKKKREKEEKEKAKKEKEEERKVKMREGKDKKDKEKDKKKRSSGRSSALCVPSGSTSSLDEEKDDKVKKSKKKEKPEVEDKEHKDHVNVVLSSHVASTPERTRKTEEERAEERDTIKDTMEGPSVEILQKPRFSTSSVLETPEEGETSVVRKEEVREEEHEEEIEPGVFVKTKRIVKMTTVKTSSYVEVPVSPDGRVLDERQHEIPVSPIEKLALGPLMATPTGARVTSRTMEEHEGKEGKEVHRTTTVRTMKFKGKTDDGSVPDIDDFMKRMAGDTGPRKAVLPDKIPNLSRRGRKVAWVAKKLRTLNVLEDAYPNVVTVKQIIQEGEFDQCEMAIVCCILEQLQGKGLANELEKGKWIRVQNLEAQNGETHVSVEEDNGDEENADEKVDDIADEEQSEEAAKKVHKVERVKMMPVLSGNEQPTVAVITLLYAEKLAVDAMMDHKTTYVKFKTEGEGQVYTMGMIGQHKVVSTKLARIGHGEGAKISSGNTVTRLLGTFSAIEHVFLVGVAGSVPMLRDDTKHVRLGDVVVAKPEYPGGPLYAYCTGADEDAQGGFSFNSCNYNTRDDTIGNLVKSRMEHDNGSDPDWARILEETITFLHARESRFYRPAVETDRVFKMVTDHTEECTHPPVTPGSPRDLYPRRPVVQYGIVAGGRLLSENESVRRDFALMNDVKGVDFGFHAVMDSIEGNRKDSFMVIRGIADYGDGMSKREWQPYASVAAASYMKALILNLPAPANQ